MEHPFVPLAFERLSVDNSRSRAQDFRALVRRRRSVREFAADPVPLDLIDTAIEAAGTAPSGANRQGEHKHKNYYVQESVGIAVGLLLTALHVAGLATLTHTPSPMGFLREILRRPKHEVPFVLIPVGYPAAGARVPDLSRKSLDNIRELV